MIRATNWPGCVLAVQSCWAASAGLARKLGFHAQPLSTKSDDADGPPDKPPQTLTPQQLQAVQAAVTSATQHAAQATSLATLTGMAGSYRDITVSLEALYTAQVQGQNPLYAAPVPATPPPPSDPYLCSTLFPLVDVSQIPDDDPSVPQGPQQYDKQYMDRITCWMQTQPNHVETSTMLQTGIALFPPQEATYPTYVDFQAATRLLERHKSRRRMGVLRKIRRFQDKYQLKTWDHRKGE